MQAKQRLRCVFEGDDRVVVGIGEGRRRPKAGSLRASAGPPETAPPGPPAREIASAFAARVELAGQVVAALAAEAQCLRVSLPGAITGKLERIEAELEIAAHDIVEFATACEERPHG